MMISPVRRITFRKAAIVLLFLVAVNVALIPLVLLEENWRGRRAWEHYVSEARSRGARIDLAEFIPPPLVDADNFAATPLFTDLFTEGEEGKELLNGLDFPETGELQAPKLGDPSEGDRMNLEQWRDYFLKSGMLQSAGQSPAADILQALERYEPLLTQVREVSARPSARFPVKWERGFAAQMPHMKTLQQLARIFSLKAAAHLELGNSAAACREVRNELRLCRALDREPVLIPGLVRLSILERTLLAVSTGLAAHHWAEPELRAIQEDLASFRMWDDLQFTLDSERGITNLQIGDLARMNGRELASVMTSLTGSDASKPQPTGPVTPWTLYPNGWIRQNQVLINELYDAQLARCAHIEREGVLSAPVDTRLDKIAQGPVLRRIYYLFSMITMPVVQSAERKFFYVNTQVQQARIACALERYWLAHGTYPSDLEALSPEYLEEIPRDVLGAAPMKYRLTAEGIYVMWSVGYNGTDEGGAVDLKKKGREQADWVWQFRRVAELPHVPQP